MRIQLKGPGHAANSSAELNRCRQTRRYCDVFSQVGSRTFAAHRAVSACAGAYFHNSFGRAPATPSPHFASSEFVSAANFEKVSTFVYTGEVVIDSIDVGVSYESAERSGVGESVRACHATFPDSQASVSAKAVGEGELASDPGAMAAAPSLCSSAASCSSLSSSVGQSAAPTPAAAPSPSFQTGTGGADREAHVATLTSDLKAEDFQSHVGYGQAPADFQSPGSRPVLQSKTEQESDGRGGSCGDCQILPVLPSDSCSIPDSSAQSGAEACAPTSSSGEPPGGSREAPSDGGGAAPTESKDAAVEPRGNGAQEEEEEEEEEVWRRLTGEIIESSDDETYMEEEEDEDDSVCLENGGARDEGNTSSSVSRNSSSCKACSAPLPADPVAVKRHAEGHLTESGLCRSCGASFPDRAAAVAHSLSHVGVRLFACEMCRQEFCSRGKSSRHHHQTSSAYSIPQGASIGGGGGQGSGSESKCAVCTKTLSKDFQALRDHSSSHVCSQTSNCGVCHLPQLSSCSSLWHALAHLSSPVFACPHCARCFVERPSSDRHVAAHADEAAAQERERSASGGHKAEEIRGSPSSQTFRSSDGGGGGFQFQLGSHTTEFSGNGGGPGCLGKRKADQSSDCPPSSSSSSPRDVGCLSKINSGLGMAIGFSVPEKILQGPVPGFPSGGSTNGSQEGSGAAASVRGKWYRCRFCGKRFAHSGEFTYHLRIHTGEKPYQCKVCSRFFRGRSTMICHSKTHAGALMYRCTVCGLYFSTLKSVSSHMELHKDHSPPDFNIEQTFMYNDHSKEPSPGADA